MSTVLRFTANNRGRDFVVGDIHGCFDMLRSELAQVAFDESKDRLFSVGDLVDRGPSSAESIEWIAKPWFHAVRGNHEQMAIGVAAGRHDKLNYAMNGGDWFLAQSADRQRLFADAFDTLPIAIEVEAHFGRVGIVHADICGGSWGEFLAEVEAGLSNGRRHKLVEAALWSRKRIQAKDASGIGDLALLFVGHTPVDHPLALGNVVYIDTGAVFGRRLSLLEITRFGQMAEAA